MSLCLRTYYSPSTLLGKVPSESGRRLDDKDGKDERERSLVVFSTPLRPGGLILRHRYHTLLGFGSCEIDDVLCPPWMREREITLVVFFDAARRINPDAPLPYLSGLGLL